MQLMPVSENVEDIAGPEVGLLDAVKNWAM
jgi:hypothetical protein